MNSAICLSRALKTLPIIHCLYMAHCDLGNDPEILSVILQSDGKHIHLSHPLGRQRWMPVVEKFSIIAYT